MYCKPQTPQANEAVPTLSDGAKALYAVLPCEPAHINDLAAAAKVEVRMALAAMTELEIAGLTQSFPGRRFCRKLNR